MHKDFTIILKCDDPWLIASCPEMPGAYGQGRTMEEARTSLAEAIALIQEHQEFEREAVLVCRNQELMEFLDLRSRPERTYTIQEAR